MGIEQRGNSDKIDWENISEWHLFKSRELLHWEKALEILNNLYGIFTSITAARNLKPAYIRH